MFIIRNVKTHEVVERGFTDRSTAEKRVVELVNRDWKQYEAYPEKLA